MQSIRFSPIALAALAITVTASGLQAQSDGDRVVADGGIHVAGWMGTVDPRAAASGASVETARFSAEDGVFHVVTGPAVTYWSPDNRVSGNYTVSATFREPQYMNLNDHPHPYGIVIAGNDMGTDQQSYLYCSAYGNGRFIVRGFGPEPFQMNGRRAQEHEAVHQAAGRNEPVTQEIAMSVTDDAVLCRINGVVVASYPKSEVLGEGKLTSTDGVWGLRFSHNTEGLVSDVSVSVTQP